MAVYEMRSFLVPWFGHSFSALGSAHDGLCAGDLVIWYGREGSALMIALLVVCSYAPYVLLSIFAGALSDRWNKKAVMLACDSVAALTTVAVLAGLGTSVCLWFRKDRSLWALEEGTARTAPD